MCRARCSRGRHGWSRRRLLVSAGIVCVPLVVLAGWLLVQARAAQAHLLTAQVAISQFKAELLGHGEVSSRDLDRIREHTGAARAATSDPAWVAVAHLPLVGRPLHTVQGLSVAADQVATEVLPDLVRLRQLAAAGRIVREDGALDLDRVATAAPVLERAGRNLSRIQDGLAGLPGTTGIGRVDGAYVRLTGQLAHLADSVRDAGTAARLLVPALGSSGPRSYFVAFQTNAEARGTGGLVGAFGIVTADHGRITLHDVSADDALPAAGGGLVDLGPDFEHRYAADQSTRLLANSNLSAHFPYAAQVWLGLWRQRTGQQLDGAIATDPVGLGHLLEAVGPVQLPDGEQLTAANAVALTESTLYARYTEPRLRKRFQIEVAQAVADALLHRSADPAALLRAVRESVAAGRLRLWSADGATQTVLEHSAVGGSVPQEPGPFAALVVNNSAGTKLDYYLDRSLSYELGPCQGGSRASTVRIRLASRAPATGLPDYVVHRSDDPARPHPAGSNRAWVSLYASVGAQLVGASLDGQPLLMSPSVERGHLLLASEVELGADQTREMEIHLQEPASAREPVVPVQPLVRPQTTQVVAASCSGAG